MHDLNGNFAIEVGVKTLVDMPHTAATNEALDSKAVDI